MKKNKYGNKKVKAFGLTFDSQKEYARYQELLLLQRAKAIESLHYKYLLHSFQVLSLRAKKGQNEPSATLLILFIGKMANRL